MNDIENGIRGPNDEYVSQGEIFNIGSLFPILSKKSIKKHPNYNGSQSVTNSFSCLPEIYASNITHV